MKIKNLVPFALILSVFLSACSGYATADTPSSYTFLLLGKDDAAANTDSIAILHFDVSSSALSIMQLPRDTYLENDVTSPKINRIFPALKNKLGEMDALAATAALIGEAIGIPFDGAVCFSPSSVEEAVNSFDGVTVSVPVAFSYTSKNGDFIHVPAASVLLNGESAVAFIRHRSQYAEADIGRVDAQKLFYSAFLHTALDKMNPTRLLTLSLNPPTGIFICGDAKTFLSLGRHILMSRSSLSCRYFTVPGEAIQSDGTWYYVLNKNATGTLISSYFGISFPNGWDSSCRFCKNEAVYEIIYNRQRFSYRVYDDAALSELSVKSKE